MFDVLAQIQLIIASAGNEPEPKKNGFELFSKALKAIGDAVKLVGNIPEKAIEKAADQPLWTLVLHDPSYI